MSRRASDEIASMLLARVVREVENFTGCHGIDVDAKSHEIWHRFVEHLKERELSSPRACKKMPSKKAQ